MVRRAVGGIVVLAACLVGVAWSARAQEPQVLATIRFVDAAGVNVVVAGGCIKARYLAEPQTPVAICDGDPVDAGA